MTNRPRSIGTKAETAVCRYLADNGWPHAERRTLKGVLDQGDITGTPGICWEIKGGEAAATASDGLVSAWLEETETERINARADIGVLVMRRRGIGPLRAGDWWAVVPGAHVFPTFWEIPGLRHAPVRLHLATACRLLLAIGYGDDTPTGDRRAS